MAEFLGFIAPTRLVAIQNYIRAHFSRWDDDDQDIPPDLEAVRPWALSVINDQAEAQRGVYITARPGKVGEYRQKEEEFRRWEVASRPSEPAALEYPIATLESAEYGITPAEMLDVWGQRVVAWALASAQIAALERRALLAIEAAGSVGEIEAVLAAVEWG